MVCSAVHFIANPNARRYAEAAFTTMNCGSVTLNPYMGFDCVEPFLKDPSRAVFLLCKTSNPSASDFETLPLQSGEALFENIAKTAVKWNKNENIGLVVGATDAESLQKVRRVAPEMWILAPGIGFQVKKILIQKKKNNNNPNHLHHHH